MSHHFDSPTAIEDGRINLCDLYAFPGSPGTSTLILTVNPDAGRSSPTTFRPDALYEFVIAGRRRHRRRPSLSHDLHRARAGRPAADDGVVRRG